MYIPPQFAVSDVAVLHQLIKDNPFATWVTMGNEPTANHLPLLIEVARGVNGTLLGHVARANPVWQSFSRTVDSLVIFHGPQAYISPSWYASKQEHGKAVPTWNYAVVHVHGMPRVIEDREWLLNHVTALSEHHEMQQAQRWKVADAPPDYIDKLLGAIVGIEIPIAKMAGKWKLSQNRSLADQHGVMMGLQARGDMDSRQMAEMIRLHKGINS